MVRLELDRLVEVGDGAVKVAFSVIDEAAAGVRRGKVWPEPDRLVEVGDGAIVVALAFVSLAAMVVDDDVFRSTREHAVAGGDGLICWRLACHVEAVVAVIGGHGADDRRQQDSRTGNHAVHGLVPPRLYATVAL